MDAPHPQEAARRAKASPRRRLEVLIVSLGSTEGLRRADEELCDSLERAGAHVTVATARAPAARRTLMLTDLGWAWSARAAAIEALAQTRSSRPPAVVYSSTTAALMGPCPGAVRFDAPSAGNRPGRHGLWQRPLERRRLARASLLLPWSEGALRELPAAARDRDRTLVVPVPVEPSGPPRPTRDIAAITYAANPVKKGLDRVLAAWRVTRERRPGGGALAGSEELVVAGASARDLERAGFSLGAEKGVRVVGALPPAEYRALVRRARVFVCAPHREDYGIAQLEALADGCLLVTTPAPGPYVALPIAHSLDRRLVCEDLGGALCAAFDGARADYATRALEALAPFRRAAVDRLVVGELYERLLGDST